MANTLETAHILSDELELEREQFIDENALAALRLELASLAITAPNTIFPEYIED